MDRKRLMLAGVLIVVMGVVFVMLNGMNSSEPAPVATPETKVIVQEVEYTRVLGVVEPLQKGSRIREGDLNWIDWPTEAVTPALIVDDPNAEVPVTEQLVGALVRDPVQPGEPLTFSKFIRAGEAGIMAALLKPGMRATTVRISVDTAAGGFIQPGDRVDIILKEVLGARAVADGGTGQAEITASTIFKNVLVLAIDQSFTNNPEGGAAIPGSTATLELSPEDSEDIIVAQDKGDLVLVLRGFSGATSPAPSRAAKPREDQLSEPPLMVFRRGNVETVQLQQR
jgi:pilus assembly protein CpaB